MLSLRSGHSHGHGHFWQSIQLNSYCHSLTLIFTRNINKQAMKAISKSKLKSRLLEFLRFVEAEGEEIVVTDRGTPVVKIVKYAEAPATEALFGNMRGKVQYFEDLAAPTTDEWPEL